ncbi:Transposon TX1 uncharacterized protein [Merluccius polli]|uniref:Transposon TX1 uncharacterized protein n=1 Tax=Merluccius polli TaxID=89951 RepID=A0AA47PCE8_MERPO|nr:Transposon TX1 uncharacterized protein [Merluccius polli]
MPTQESLGDSLIAAFMGAGMTKLGHLLDRENGRWKLALEVSAQTGVRYLRLVADLLDRLRVSLPTSLSAAASSAVAGIPEHVVFPELRISPKCISRGQGHLLTFNGLTDLVFASVNKKSLYHICSKSLFFMQLANRQDTKWRQHGQVPPNLSPTWRLLYKPPISKRVGDLQWRVLHLAIPTNRFVSRFNPDVMPTCPFCSAPDTAKLAIYKTHKTEMEEGNGKDLVGVFKVMFEKLTRRHAIKLFPEVQCSVEEAGLAVGEVVGYDCVRSASRMNRAIVLFLDSTAKVEHGGLLQGEIHLLLLLWVRGEIHLLLLMWLRGEIHLLLLMWLRGEIHLLLLMWLRGEIHLLLLLWLRGEIHLLLLMWFRGEIHLLLLMWLRGEIRRG